ncbi:hypothetical protein AMTR_s00096p00169890 [Amborella trichopoda]|uniref:Uncharacterized protein n=1 Tax=Amborella trichopoda TaxID=13333 RepID=W1P466_AMBTC|nr:hypothetical protein AMTR_s00096p00169890 [Amborella trichopoda]
MVNMDSNKFMILGGLDGEETASSALPPASKEQVAGNAVLDITLHLQPSLDAVNLQKNSEAVESQHPSKVVDFNRSNDSTDFSKNGLKQSMDISNLKKNNGVVDSQKPVEDANILKHNFKCKRFLPGQNVAG